MGAHVADERWVRARTEWSGPAGQGWLPGLQVLEELGRGASTVVYRARLNDVDYGLKVFSPAPGDDRDVERVLVGFRREAAIVASIGHPGLPRIYDVGQVGGRPYLLMDLVDGQTLADVLRAGPVPAVRAAHLAADLAEALASVHRKGLVHRDVKPQNIIIDSAGQARLIDFGLAAAEAAGFAGMAGTLAYAAPEQSGVLKRPVDGRADLYSLGVVLFECLTGTPPFAAEDTGDLLRMHAVVAPPDVRSLVDTVPPTLGAVVAMLLAKDPDDRYQCGGDLVADLRRFIADPAAVFAPGRRATGEDRRGGEPLCGRDRELARLLAEWERARGGRGGACVIRGPAGSGKSRLVAELCAMARRQRALVLSGACSADEAMPLAPLRFAVEGALQRLAWLDETDRAWWCGLLRSAAGASAPLLGALGPSLAQLFGAAEVSDGERRESFTTAVTDFLRAAARACGGLLLHIDDVQWIDPASRRVVARLAEDIRDVPVLLVCTGRDDAQSLPATEEFCAVLGGRLDLDFPLAPLTEEGIADLVAAHLPSLGAGATLPRLLAVRSNGNPFVALEYLRAVIDAGLLRPSWHGWLLDEEGMRALDLPGDALGLVLARVGALGGYSRWMLTVAAAVGARFRPDLVARVCDTDLDLTLAVIAEAAGHRLVEVRVSGEVVFLHNRIREALLDGLPDGERRRLHRHIADALTELGDHRPRAVYKRAYHYMLGDQAGARTRIFTTCLAAGRLALADHAPAAAVAFLLHAERTGEHLDPAFLHTIGVALHRDGRYAEAAVRLEQALAAEPRALGRAEILLELGGVYRSSWNAGAALDAVHRGLAELHVPVAKRSLGAIAVTVAFLAAGLFVALTGIGRGTAGGRRARRYELIVSLHSVAGYIGTETMRPGMLVRHELQKVYPVYRLGRGSAFAHGLAGFGFTSAMLGLWRLSDRCFRRAESVARDLRDPERLAIARWYAGAAAYLGGRDDGAAWAQAMLEHGRWLESGWQDDAYASLAWDAAVAGRTREAASWYQRRAHAPTGDEASELSAMVTIGAVVSAAEGQAVEAGTALRRLRPILTKDHRPGLYVNLLLAEVFACLEQEDFSEPFERATRELLDLRLSPRLTIRQHRLFWVHVALGRIAQCGLAGDDGQAAGRRKAAATALRQLKRVANTRFTRGAYRLARAQLQLVDGHPEQCLRGLADLPPLQPDAPMIAYETARTRARALRSLGHDAESTRQAVHACQIALGEGWPHRARSIRTEFDLSAHVIHDPNRARASTTHASVDRQRLLALAAVSKAAMRVVDPDTLARIALDETIRVLAAERAFLFLSQNARTGTDPGPLVPHLGRDATGNDLAELTGYTTTLVELAAVNREPIVVTGTEEGAALGARSAVTHGLRSILVAPLLLDGRVLGVVYLDSQVAKGIFTAEDADILTAITDYIATSLETARAAQLEVSVQKAREQRDVAQMLHDALTQMTASLDPGAVLDRLLDHAARIRPGQDACLLIRAASTVTVRLLPRDASTPVTAALPEEQSMARLWMPGATAGQELPAWLGAHLGPVASWFTLPLLARKTALGALVLASPDSVAYRDAEAQLAAALVAQAMTAYDNAMLFAQVRALAVADELTALPNRRRFHELAQRELSAARRHGRPVVVVMADIDHFKHINDGYGHPTGDDVIRAVAGRIAGYTRSGDVCARYGGEEFAVLLPDTDLDSGVALAQRMRRAVAEPPVPTRSGPLRVTVSLGVAGLAPTDTEIDDLLARADNALYQAKRQGRDRVWVD